MSAPASARDRPLTPRMQEALRALLAGRTPSRLGHTFVHLCNRGLAATYSPSATFPPRRSFLLTEAGRVVAEALR